MRRSRSRRVGHHAIGRERRSLCRRRRRRDTADRAATELGSGLLTGLIDHSGEDTARFGEQIVGRVELRHTTVVQHQNTIAVADTEHATQTNGEQTARAQERREAHGRRTCRGGGRW